MVLKNFIDFVGYCTLRNGKTFAQYYIVPNPSFDFDALGLAAAEQEADEPLPSSPGDEEEDNWEDIEDEPLTPLSSAPPSPAMNPAPLPKRSPTPPSPLSSLSSLSPLSSPTASRSPSPSQASRKSSPTQHSVKGNGRKRRRKEHSRRNRAKKRRRGRDVPTARDRERHRACRVLDSEPQNVDIDLDKAPVASTGFRGLYEGEIACTHTREELVENHDFIYYPWDGRTTTPLVTQLADEPPSDEDDASESEPALPVEDDASASEPAPPVEDDIVIGCLAGCPSDGEGSGHPSKPNWATSTTSLADEIEEKRSCATFGREACVHRRGHFGTQACGISHGGGQLCPGNLKHSVAMTLVLMYLISLPAMVRIAHFGSSAFASWAPAVHDYYGETLLSLLASDPALTRNFRASVWAAITINFGPRTVTFPHRDYGNLPFGWCAITALGDYDPDKGGDLILWDCKMIIRFPPGSTILIPSAILRHSNTRIAPNKRRYSVTQYSAGALFRWVEHGFQLDEKYFASLSKKERAQDRRTAASRWRKGRAMFSKLKDLVAAAEKKLDA